MLDQAIFDLARAYAVARRLEDIVSPPLVPEVAVCIAFGEVTGSAPVAGEFAVGGGNVLPVAQKEDRVGITVHVEAVDRHIAGHAHRAFAAFVIDHRHPVAGVGLAHAAGPGWPHCRAVAHDVVDLGLAEHLVDRDAELLAAVVKHRVAHRLTGAHDALQLEFEMFARLRIGLHHGLERRGEQKGVRHAVLLHQAEGQLGTEAAVEGHDGPAEIERGQQGIHQPPGPGPVCGTPEH